MNKYPNILVEFTRNQRTNQRNGVVVGTSRNKIGWSLCKKGDKFDPQFGLKIAFGRIEKESVAPIPHEIKSVYENMKSRAERYFKVTAPSSEQKH